MSLHKGSTLATVLLVLAVAMTLVFVVAQASVMHLRFSTEWETRQIARNLAESALNTELSRVLEAEAFGKNRAGGQSTRVEGGTWPEGAYGFASFNQGEADAVGVPWSTNNLGNLGTAAGDGRTVPQSTVHLVAVGHCGAVEQRVEALYYRPPFPKALAATGTIRTEGPLRVVGLEAGAPYPGNPDSIPVDDRERAGIHSNSPDSRAVVLGPECRISGDVGAVGRIEIDPSTVVGGEVRANTNPQPLPRFDLPALMAQVRAVGGTQTLTGSVPPLTLDWFGRSDGDLTITGDLILRDGVLCVQRNLTVEGAIQGQGVVLAGGNVTVRKGSRLDAQNVVALAAAGNVSLLADSAVNYYFQGLVYAKAGLEARDITILGSALCDGGNMQLHNVTAVSTRNPSDDLSDVWIGVPMSSYEEKKGGGIKQQWPEGPHVSARPRVDPQTGEKRFDVRVRVIPPGAPYDRIWKNLTFEQGMQLGRDLRKGNPVALPHNQSLSDSIYRVVNEANDARPGTNWLVNLSLNNLLTTGERSRVLLWQTL